MKRLLLLCLLLAGCSDDDDPGRFQGYLEGEFLQIAPEVGGRITEIAVAEGDDVPVGALLFRLDETEAVALVAQAAAALARQQAELLNLGQGRRPTELAVIDAQIAEAQAALERAQKDFKRQEELFARRVVAESALDSAREAVAVASARVDTQKRQRDVAALPARIPEIAAGERNVQAAQAALEQAESRLAKHQVHAPAAALVDDVHYEPGEVATAGTAILSLLPPDGRKVVFFVPEPLRKGVAKGATVAVSCDGCPAELLAVVIRLASEAEYTPPVIYSRESRGKLVFRAEARLSGTPAMLATLPLGQPVDVAPADPGPPAGAAP